MSLDSALFDQLRRAEGSIHSAALTLKKALSTVPVDALGLSWRFTPYAVSIQSLQKPGIRGGKALLQQVHSATEQLRSQSVSLAQGASLAQSTAQPSGEQTRTDASDDKLVLVLDRADQMVALAFALERVAPELEDMLEELEMASHQGSGAHLEFANKPHFTCPVCFDDEVSVQDAFVVSACGHPICRPCAIRSVDFNIKQLQPQVCPSCMGIPCPVCPISIWQRTRDLEERRSQRRMQRRAELRPGHSSTRQQQQRTAELQAEGDSGGHDRVPGSQGEENEHDVESAEARAMEEEVGRRRRGRRRAAAAAHGSGALGAGDEDQHAQQHVQQNGWQREQQESEYAGPPPPQVKHCCMTQADMRLLLQPEELQQEQLEMFAQCKRVREQRRQQEQQQQQQQQQVGKGGGHKRRHAAPDVGPRTAKRRVAAADAAAAPELMQGKDRHGMEREGTMILSDSDDEVLMCIDKGGSTGDKGCMGEGSESLRDEVASGAAEAVRSSSATAAAAAAAAAVAAAAAAAAAAAVAEREKAEEEEEAAELPPTYEAYLKAEALRAAHSGGLFQLCPKCGEGIELIASGPEKNRLRCPTCECDKCLSCGVDWHEGSTCEQFQQWSRENASADEEFKKLISSREIQACPRCGTATAKVPGYCDHMRCKCGCTYCYKCGREKTGSSAHNHGCSCMNGAAWRHDWRANLPPGDPPLPPAPGGPRPPPPVQAPVGRVHIRRAPAAPAAAAPAPAAAGEQPRGGRAHQKAHLRRGAPAQAGAAARREDAAPRVHQRHGVHVQASANVQAGAQVQAGAAARQQDAAPRAHRRHGAPAQAGANVQAGAHVRAGAAAREEAAPPRRDGAVPRRDRAAPRQDGAASRRVGAGAPRQGAAASRRVGAGAGEGAVEGRPEPGWAGEGQRGAARVARRDGRGARGAAAMALGDLALNAEAFLAQAVGEL